MVLAKKLYQVMMMFEATTILVNLATKLKVTAAVFLIDTRTPEMINVIAWNWSSRAAHLLADYRTFQEYITALFAKCILGPIIQTWNQVVNFAAHTLGMSYSICRTEMVNFVISCVSHRTLWLGWIFCICCPDMKPGLEKIFYRLIVMFLSTEIFSKRRKIYAWAEEKPE